MEPIIEFESKESESEESENEESKSEESENEESESKESKNEKLRKENKKLKKELKKENERLKKELIEKNDNLVINNKFLISFKNYLNQIIYWHINIPIIQKVDQEKFNIRKKLVEHYQKILDDYKNKKFYIINSFNIIKNITRTQGTDHRTNISEGSFVLFINNYGYVYGFNIVRDQWDKIISCNLIKFHSSKRPNEISYSEFAYNLNLSTANGNGHIFTSILNNYILNNNTFKYESELSPNKIKLISNLPFNDTDSKQLHVLFSYLNFIYTYG